MRRTCVWSSLVVLFAVACGGKTTAKGLPALEIELDRGDIDATDMHPPSSYSGVFVTAPLGSRTDGPCEIVERRPVAGIPQHGRPEPDIGTVEVGGVGGFIIPRKSGFYGSWSSTPGYWREGELVDIRAGGGATLDLSVMMPSKAVVLSPAYAKELDEQNGCDGHLAVPVSEDLVVRSTRGDVEAELVVDLWATPLLRARCTGQGPKVTVPRSVLAWLASQDGPRWIRIGALRESDAYVGENRVAITLLSSTDRACLDFSP